MMAVLCLIGASFMAAAEVSVEEAYRYYKIKGDSTSELRKSINRKRNKNTGLKGFDASTHWTIAWTFKFIPTHPGCRITQASVTVDIEYRLPKWQLRDKSTNSVTNEAWDIYINNLRDHELVHGNIAKKTVYNIESQLLKSQIKNGTCQTLQTQANRVASQLVSESRQQHIEFDTITNHGSNTGVTFP